DEVTAVAINPDPNHLEFATGCPDAAVRLWTVGNGLVGHSLPHRGGITALAYSSDGKTLLTASDDGTARLWDRVNERSAGAVLPHGGAAAAVAFRRDGRVVVTGGRDRLVRVFDTKKLAVGRPLV